MNRLILASQSPRRRKILQFAGIPFKAVEPTGVEEKRLAGESPAAMARRLAVQKASFVARKFPHDWVLGADTVVELKRRPFGKPAHPGEALKMIRQLQGKAHRVCTGVALVGEGGRRILSHVESTKVLFRKLSKEEMAAYVRTKEPYDKAGAYAIQGTARSWIRRWEGDYFNVMGLPLSWVIETANQVMKPKPTLKTQRRLKGRF